MNQIRNPVRNLFRYALTAGLGLMLAGRVTAQTFTTLYSFTGGSDGANPYSELVLSSNVLYGTTYRGGNLSFGRGVIFKINTDGTGFTNLHSFASSDGANPYAGLTLSGATLYGTTFFGGNSGWGTLFAINTDGTGFTNLYNFTAPSLNDDSYYTNSDGIHPQADLILSGHTLYGTATGGGSSGNGTIFAVNTDGTGFTNLHSFSATSIYYPTNNDGASPYAGLVLSDNTLYGTTAVFGGSGGGTVFALTADGTSFTNLHTFVSSDGANPYGGLILSDNTLYGTTAHGGSSSNGTLFRINIGGTGFANLHSFTALTNHTNSDGGMPEAGLILSGSSLYGTANSGSLGHGVVFAVNTDGSGFTILHSFAGSDGAGPTGSLILSGKTLYGTTVTGGSFGQGTVFSMSLVPHLTITPSETNVILTWPTNVAGFDCSGFSLQFATNLGAPAAWTTNSITAVIVNGQYTVTNPIAGVRTFYRLIQ